MNKMREYEAGRADGLDLALRIVRDGGLEALEKEIKFRGVSGVHTSLASKDLDKASQKIKERTLDTVTVLAVAVLHDKFNFGQLRCKRFIEGMEFGTEYLMKDIATWDDYRNSIEEELGIPLKIRVNE